MDVFQLEITVLQADGLAPKDKNFFGIKTRSDPYVEIKLMPKGEDTKMHDKLLVGKTVPILKTLSPVWDDPLTYTVELPQKHFSEAAMFELTIMDYDKHSEDDLMGVVPVHIPTKHPNLHNVPPSPVSLTKWYGVPATSAEGEEATGRVQCTMNIKVAKSAAARKNSSQQKDQGEEMVQQRLIPRSKRRGDAHQSQPDTVRVEFLDLELDVIRGNGLAAKDSFVGIKTSSDPYCEVRLLPGGPADSNKIYIGKTNIQMHTLKPKWNASFAYSMPKKDFDPWAIFELTIMDYDEKTEDDLMGVVPVHIPIGKSGSTTQWYNVPHDSANGGKATGKIECTLSVTRVIQEVPKEELMKPKKEEKPAEKALNFAKSSSRAPRNQPAVVSDEEEEEEEGTPTPQQSTSKYSKALSTAKINTGLRHLAPQASQVGVTQLTSSMQQNINEAKRAEVQKNLEKLSSHNKIASPPADTTTEGGNKSISAGLSMWAEIGANKTSGDFSVDSANHSSASKIRNDGGKSRMRRSRSGDSSGTLSNDDGAKSSSKGRMRKARSTLTDGDGKRVGKSKSTGTLSDDDDGKSSSRMGKSKSAGTLSDDDDGGKSSSKGSSSRMRNTRSTLTDGDGKSARKSGDGSSSRKENNGEVLPKGRSKGGRKREEARKGPSSTKKISSRPE